MGPLINMSVFCLNYVGIMFELCWNFVGIYWVKTRYSNKNRQQQHNTNGATGNK